MYVCYYLESGDGDDGNLHMKRAILQKYMFLFAVYHFFNAYVIAAAVEETMKFFVVCMYVCINIYVYVYVCMYVCMHVRLYAYLYVNIGIRMFVCMFFCMYVCMYVVNANVILLFKGKVLFFSSCVERT